MSIINRMLRELDKRQAAADGSQASAGATQASAAGEAAQVGSSAFWWVVAAVIGIALAWLVWVVWQLAPRTIVNEVALRPFPRAASVAGGQSETPAGGERADTLDMLKLATEITTPILGRRAGTVAATSGSGPAAVAPAKNGTRPGSEAAASASAARASDAFLIDRRQPDSVRNRAEAEYGRGMGLVGQGRVPEGMEALRAALAADPAYEPARQSLVSLLIEQRRLDDAAGVLQEGLSMRPANADYAMLLARILVDRQDTAGALGVLQKYAPGAGAGADYHGFAAALHQRLGQHSEAISEYQAALRLSPQSGIWWLGLGISQEAGERRKEAADSFRRALSAGLSADLSAYVNQRLRQMQQ